MNKQSSSISMFFSNIKDPRAKNSTHNLMAIFSITVIAVLCGCDDWEEIVLYAKCKEGFLKRFLDLPNGIPSHDTFERVFKRIDPSEFEKCFVEWTKDLCSRNIKGIVSIDGKTIRGSGKHNTPKSAVHMVSAWSDENQMVLGQLKTNSKSNEITAIPLLLELLDLKGSVVTIDAMGCQKNIAAKIIEKESDYILALKGNQDYLHEEVKNAFENRPAQMQSKTVEKDHGRIETRECTIINDMGWIYESEKWAGLKSIIRIQSKREMGDKTLTESRYYISSLSENADIMNQYVRKHWGVENSLHWVLDVNFKEDKSRNRTGHSAENLSIVRRITLNTLKMDKTTKLSINKKRLKASLDNRYLLKLLTFKTS